MAGAIPAGHWWRLPCRRRSLTCAHLGRQIFGLRGVHMQTLGSRLAAAKDGRPSGFDYLRIGLAVAVMVWHAPLLTIGMPFRDAVEGAGLTAVPNFIVPSFFALSGFLVAGSLDRNDLASFMTLRAIRIFPALTVEVVVSALVLGMFLTTVSWREYVSDPEFRAYFLNIVGYIHYQLPGVFETNPWGDRVNGQLWTVPFELECYVALFLLALVRLHKLPWLFLGLGLLLCAGLSGVEWYNPVTADATKPPGRMIVICFLLGVALFRLKDRIPMNLPLLAVSLAASWVTLGNTELIYLAPLPVAYVTAYLGLLEPPRSILTERADYSYGIYLYGYAVQQAWVYVLGDSRHWITVLIGSLVVTTAIAAASWHLVEWPIMKRRKPILAWVQNTTLRFPLIKRMVTI